MDESPDDIRRLLDSVGCNPESCTGINRYFRCPRCSHLRTKGSRIKCLSVRADGEGYQFNCHHCGWHGGIYYNTRIGRRALYRDKHIKQKTGVRRLYGP